MKTAKDPLSVSGRVFVDKLLAYERRDLALPESLKKGDLKIICIAKHPTGVHGYSGFFVAYIFDGARWRKLALRDGAAFKSTYKSVAERTRQLQELVDGLRALKGRESIWADRAYWVPVKPALSQPVAPVQHPLPVSSIPPTVPAPAPRKGARRAKSTEPSAQLLLFR